MKIILQNLRDAVMDKRQNLSYCHINFYVSIELTEYSKTVLRIFRDMALFYFSFP